MLPVFIIPYVLFNFLLSAPGLRYELYVIEANYNT
jgi:hypothetical protein